jgi:hypothetical protein
LFRFAFGQRLLEAQYHPSEEAWLRLGARFGLRVGRRLALEFEGRLGPGRCRHDRQQVDIHRL